MAEKVIVKAEKRTDRGKNVARRLRAAGRIPVIVYGAGGESVAATAAIADLAAILRSDSGQNTVFSFDLDGDAADVIFQDRQVDPIRGRLMHADLRRLVKGEKIEMTVGIHLIGEPIGVKEDGGMLEQQMRELKILCEPALAPDAINVDVTTLRINESVHVSDLTVGEGIEIHVPGDALVASVIYVKEPELAPQVEEGAEPAVEGEAAPTTAPEGEGGGES